MTITTPIKIAQESISLLARDFDVILASDGERYMSISAICDTLDLLAGPQKRRIKRNASLLSGLRMLVITTSGGDQPTNCLNIEQINAWLEGVQVDALSSFNQKKLSVLVCDLLPVARNTFQDIFPQSSPDLNAKTEIDTKNKNKTSLVLASEVAVSLPKPEQQYLFGQLSRFDHATHLVVTRAIEDAAFRESCLADVEAWNMSSNAPHFISSDNVTVYLAPPSQFINREDAHERIRILGERTVMTARIALGLWNIRRHDSEVLQKNGSVPIKVEEILEWRGITEHSRAPYTGSSIREKDGFETKYKQQVHEDFSHLQHCYMYNAQGIPIKFEGPYAHVTTIRGQSTISSQDDEILGFLFAPGGWITSQTGQALTQFAVVLEEVFKLKPHRQKIALRIALYLVERWSQLALRGNYDDPIMINDLLRASIIPIDESNISRFSGRVNRGIKTLVEHGIIGDVKEYIPPLDPKATLRERFLSTYLSLPPHREVIKKYQELAQAGSASMFPSSPPLLQSSDRKRRAQ